MGDLPVYDAVLLPPADVNTRSAELSARLSGTAETEFVLRTDGPFPHLSLYMANFPAERLGAVLAELRAIGAATPPVVLAGDRFAGNEHGMFEIFYRKTDAVTRLQHAVLARLDPLRTGLRRRDPVGRVIADHRRTAPPVAAANLDRYGYDEIGELFRPHITVTRFRDPALAPADAPPPESFSAVFPALALCVMGEHGTCTEIVEAFDLTASDAGCPVA
ncbi:hypothetical protein [Actinomadura atramentaria]|uniref:hypothetical protein n=1 Tax=Actinomadura atramentaria TaxID=1990 RepID=UPI0003724CCE|nr:hypothetical protein [Actinomadura atramentaria]